MNLQNIRNLARKKKVDNSNYESSAQAIHLCLQYLLGVILHINSHLIGKVYYIYGFVDHTVFSLEWIAHVICVPIVGSQVSLSA